VHTGRIIAYAAIGAVSAYGAFKLYGHFKHRGPAINESAADKLPPPRETDKPEEGVRINPSPKAETVTPNPIVRSRGYTRDTLTLSGDAIAAAAPRFAVRDDGMESGTRILSYIPSLSLGPGARDSDGVATGVGSVYRDTPTVDTARAVDPRADSEDPSILGLFGITRTRRTVNV